MIIDKDFNRVVSSDEVFELPELGLSKEIPYNSTYLYPTEVKIPIEVEYDYVKNGQLYQIPHKLVVTVMSRYDASSRALYYDNTCKFSHYHKLSLEMKVGTNNIDITWQRPFTLGWSLYFHFKSKRGKEQIKSER